MESSQEVHQLTENRHATVVQYDLTSSEDELDEDHSYIYCSATKLSPMPPQNSDEENEESAVNLPSSQDSESNEEAEPSQRKRPPVIHLSSTESRSSEEEREPATSKRLRLALTEVASTESGLGDEVIAISRTSKSLASPHHPGSLTLYECKTYRSSSGDS